MQFDDPAVMRSECIERLGERSGEQFLALARRGFRLQRAVYEATAIGRCRLGGPALLEPGTPWPEGAERPMSLYAVLDTDALADWMGDDLPTRRGLLNFFYVDSDLPTDEPYRSCAVVPAGADRAIETMAPDQAPTYPTIALEAVPVTMLPDMSPHW